MFHLRQGNRTMIPRIFSGLSGAWARWHKRGKATRPMSARKMKTGFYDVMVGVDSALDLFQQPIRETHPWYWDWVAIRGDWETIGRDMERAMDTNAPPPGARVRSPRPAGLRTKK